MTHPSVPNIGCHPRILSRTEQDPYAPTQDYALCLVDLSSSGITMSCYQWAKWSLRTCIHSNWYVYNRHCIRRKPPLDNRKGVLLLHDNARPHVARVDRNTIQPLGWETLYHSSYSPDLVPSDYHHFHSLDNHFRGKSFTNEADVRQALTDLFASPTSRVLAKGNRTTENTLAECAGCHGDYFEY
ncbi:histone-lysine N-methyltransferase SETMAR [Trichonephila clavipes]|nr:histone-lysine N-methyltransferase SETMAR [Trichonephila clavipes]